MLSDYVKFHSNMPSEDLFLLSHSKAACFHTAHLDWLYTISLPSFAPLGPTLCSALTSSSIFLPWVLDFLLPLSHLGKERQPHLPFALLHHDGHELLPFQGDVHGCVPILILSVDIAALADQQLHHRHVSLDDSQVQRRLVAVVLEVDIAATLEDKNCIRVSCCH